MTTIKTMSGKTIQLLKAEISVSKHSEGKIFFNLKMVGTLVGGKKSHSLTYSPFTGRIAVSKLFGYANYSFVSPEVWAEFIKSIPVVSNDLFPCEVTPEIEAAARAKELSICTCGAVTGIPTEPPLDENGWSPNFGPRLGTRCTE